MQQNGIFCCFFILLLDTADLKTDLVNSQVHI